MADPAPDIETLVEELLQSTGLLVRRLRAEANPAELTRSQLGAIGRLYRDGAASTADLARAEGVKPQSMGATLAALERDGLVARTAHPTDGRQFLFALTPQGHEARDRHRLLKRSWLAAALARLNEEEQQALAVAVRVLRRLGDG